MASAPMNFAPRKRPLHFSSTLMSMNRRSCWNRKPSRSRRKFSLRKANQSSSPRTIQQGCQHSEISKIRTWQTCDRLMRAAIAVAILAPVFHSGMFLRVFI
jgi:hypothetical protein